jgi:cytosine deaminase
MADFDLLISNARLRSAPTELSQIAIKAGTVTAIGASIAGSADETLDARGGLTSESFCNPHLHLDKVYTLARLDDQAMGYYHKDSMGKAMTAIESASRVKAGYDEAWILDNVAAALELAIEHGNTHIRAFADIDSQAKLIGVSALLKAREAYAGRVSLQIVAFPQDGVVREPGTADLVREAMRMGADLVGGIPWIEFTDEDCQSHIDQMFDIAGEYDAGVSMLVDDAGDAGLRTLEMMAVRTIRQGWQGRVLAHHARAMALYPKPYLQKLAALLNQAQISVVTDPHTGPLHARVAELLEEHVNVCLGQDDISDAYYPYGRNNMLEVAFLASHMLWMTSAPDMELLYEMITTRAAQAMQIADHRLEVGAPANLVILNAPNVLEAFRHHAAPAAVIMGGQKL